MLAAVCRIVPGLVSVLMTLTRPRTVTTSPALQQSTRSSVSSTSIVRGTPPAASLSVLLSSCNKVVLLYRTGNAERQLT